MDEPIDLTREEPGPENARGVQASEPIRRSKRLRIPKSFGNEILTFPECPFPKERNASSWEDESECSRDDENLSFERFIHLLEIQEDNSSHGVCNPGLPSSLGREKCLNKDCNHHVCTVLHRECSNGKERKFKRSKLGATPTETPDSNFRGEPDVNRNSKKAGKTKHAKKGNGKGGKSSKKNRPPSLDPNCQRNEKLVNVAKSNHPTKRKEMETHKEDEASKEVFVESKIVLASVHDAPSQEQGNRFEEKDTNSFEEKENPREDVKPRIESIPARRLSSRVAFRLPKQIDSDEWEINLPNFRNSTSSSSKCPPIKSEQENGSNPCLGQGVLKEENIELKIEGVKKSKKMETERKKPCHRKGLSEASLPDKNDISNLDPSKPPKSNGNETLSAFKAVSSSNSKRKSSKLHSKEANSHNISSMNLQKESQTNPKPGSTINISKNAQMNSGKDCLRNSKPEKIESENGGADCMILPGKNSMHSVTAQPTKSLSNLEKGSETISRQPNVKVRRTNVAKFASPLPGCVSIDLIFSRISKVVSNSSSEIVFFNEDDRMSKHQKFSSLCSLLSDAKTSSNGVPHPQSDEKKLKRQLGKEKIGKSSKSNKKLKKCSGSPNGFESGQKSVRANHGKTPNQFPESKSRTYSTCKNCGKKITFFKGKIYKQQSLCTTCSKLLANEEKIGGNTNNLSLQISRWKKISLHKPCGIVLDITSENSDSLEKVDPNSNSSIICDPSKIPTFPNRSTIPTLPLSNDKKPSNPVLQPSITTVSDLIQPPTLNDIKGSTISIDKGSAQSSESATKPFLGYPNPSILFYDKSLCWLETCCICGGMESVKGDNEFLLCIDCGESFHSFCLSPPIKWRAQMKSFWRCPSCKVCEGCSGKCMRDPNSAYCSICDRVYHLNCLPNQCVPDPHHKLTGWICPQCSSCPCKRKFGSDECCDNRWYLHHDDAMCNHCLRVKSRSVLEMRFLSSTDLAKSEKVFKAPDTNEAEKSDDSSDVDIGQNSEYDMEGALFPGLDAENVLTNEGCKEVKSSKWNENCTTDSEHHLNSILHPQFSSQSDLSHQAMSSSLTHHFTNDVNSSNHQLKPLLPCDFQSNGSSSCQKSSPLIKSSLFSYSSQPSSYPLDVIPVSENQEINFMASSSSSTSPFPNSHHSSFNIIPINRLDFSNTIHSFVGYENPLVIVNKREPESNKELNQDEIEIAVTNPNDVACDGIHDSVQESGGERIKNCKIDRVYHPPTCEGIVSGDGDMNTGYEKRDDIVDENVECVDVNGAVDEDYHTFPSISLYSRLEETENVLIPFDKTLEGNSIQNPSTHPSKFKSENVENFDVKESIPVSGCEKLTIKNEKELVMSTKLSDEIAIQNTFDSNLMIKYKGTENESIDYTDPYYSLQRLEETSNNNITHNMNNFNDSNQKFNHLPNDQCSVTCFALKKLCQLSRIHLSDPRFHFYHDCQCIIGNKTNQTEELCIQTFNSMRLDSNLFSSCPFQLLGLDPIQIRNFLSSTVLPSVSNSTSFSDSILLSSFLLGEFLQKFSSLSFSLTLQSPPVNGLSKNTKKANGFTNNRILPVHLKSSTRISNRIKHNMVDSSPAPDFSKILETRSSPNSEFRSPIHTFSFRYSPENKSTYYRMDGNATVINSLHVDFMVDDYNQNDPRESECVPIIHVSGFKSEDKSDTLCNIGDRDRIQNHCIQNNGKRKSFQFLSKSFSITEDFITMEGHNTLEKKRKINHFLPRENVLIFKDDVNNDQLQKGKVDSFLVSRYNNEKSYAIPKNGSNMNWFDSHIDSKEKLKGFNFRANSCHELVENGGSSIQKQECLPLCNSLLEDDNQTPSTPPLFPTLIDSRIMRKQVREYQESRENERLLNSYNWFSMMGEAMSSDMEFKYESLNYQVKTFSSFDDFKLFSPTNPELPLALPSIVPPSSTSTMPSSSSSTSLQYASIDEEPCRNNGLNSFISAACNQDVERNEVSLASNNQVDDSKIALKVKVREKKDRVEWWKIPWEGMDKGVGGTKLVSENERAKENDRETDEMDFGFLYQALKFKKKRNPKSIRMPEKRLNTFHRMVAIEKKDLKNIQVHKRKGVSQEKTTERTNADCHVIDVKVEKYEEKGIQTGVLEYVEMKRKKDYDDRKASAMKNFCQPTSTMLVASSYGRSLKQDTNKVEKELKGKEVVEKEIKGDEVADGKHNYKSNLEPKLNDAKEIEKIFSKDLLEKRNDKNRKRKTECMHLRKDNRICILCRGAENEYGRMTYLYTDTWIHVLCLLWSCKLEPTSNNYLLSDIMSVIQRVKTKDCPICHINCPSVACSFPLCESVLHFPCMIKYGRILSTSENFCPVHKDSINPFHAITLPSILKQYTFQKILVHNDYVQISKKLDLDRNLIHPNHELNLNSSLQSLPLEGNSQIPSPNLIQVASMNHISYLKPNLSADFLPSNHLAEKNSIPTVMSHDFTSQNLRNLFHQDRKIIMKVGSLSVLNFGTVNWQNRNFFSSQFIFPHGFLALRLFWSIKTIGYRAIYALQILSSADQKPLFLIKFLREFPCSFHSPLQNSSNPKKKKRKEVKEEEKKEKEKDKLQGKMEEETNLRIKENQKSEDINSNPREEILGKEKEEKEFKDERNEGVQKGIEEKADEEKVWITENGEKESRVENTYENVTISGKKEKRTIPNKNKNRNKKRSCKRKHNLIGDDMDCGECKDCILKEIQKLCGRDDDIPKMNQNYDGNKESNDLIIQASNMEDAWKLLDEKLWKMRRLSGCDWLRKTHEEFAPHDPSDFNVKSNSILSSESTLCQSGNPNPSSNSKLNADSKVEFEVDRTVGMNEDESNKSIMETNFNDLQISINHNSDNISVPSLCNGAWMFGFQEREILKRIEELPGSEYCLSYKFKFKKNRLQESIHDDNGCARFRKFVVRGKERKNLDLALKIAHDKNFFPKNATNKLNDTSLLNMKPKDNSLNSVTGNLNSAHTLGMVDMDTLFEVPLAMQFRAMRQNLTKRIIVKPSHIHGKGLFALTPYKMNEMVVEYTGELIRSSVSDMREKQYKKKGVGCYFFTLPISSTSSMIIDATKKGNEARFINHSCDANVYSRGITINGRRRLIIFARRTILPNEEITLNYHLFSKEDLSKDHRAHCFCKSHNCQGFMG